MNHKNNRSRVVSWHDPATSAQMVSKMSGLEFLQAIVDGELPQPPIGNSLNLKLTAVPAGQAIFSMTPDEYHYNPIGTVHGGVAATLIDSALSCAVQTQLPAGKGYTTVELKLNYLRPLTHKTGIVRSIGTVIHSGRRIATAEAKIVDENVKLYAHGVGTCLIFDL